MVDPRCAHVHSHILRARCGRAGPENGPGVIRPRNLAFHFFAIHPIRGDLHRSPRVQLRCRRGYFFPFSRHLTCYWRVTSTGYPTLSTCTTIQYHFYYVTCPYRCIYESLLVLYQLCNYYGRYRPGGGSFFFAPPHSPFSRRMKRQPQPLNEFSEITPQPDKILSNRFQI